MQHFWIHMIEKMSLHWGPIWLSISVIQTVFQTQRILLVQYSFSRVITVEGRKVNVTTS